MSSQYIYTMNRVSKVVPPKRQIIKDISLSFFPGAKIGLLGLNGAGKSTVLKIMAGVDTDFEGEARPQPGIKVGYLAQEPELDPNKTVRESVEEGVGECCRRRLRWKRCMPPTPRKVPTSTRWPRSRSAWRRSWPGDAHTLENQLDVVADALRLPPWDAKIANLSGGEKRRVALCRLLLQKPDMLLLDEPTNHLDAESVEWLEQFLARYTGTVVAVTHDRYFLDNAAEWILELDRGRGIPWKGNYTEWLVQKDERLKQEENQEKARQKAIQKELEWSRQNAKGGRSKGKARLARLEELQSQDYQKRNETNEIFIPPGERLGNMVMEFKNVSKKFGDRLLIDNLSMLIPPGAIVGIIGPNGAGKSTLFKMITGQEKPDSGEIVIGPTVQLSYVDQSRDKLEGNHNVFQEIAGAWTSSTSTASRSSRAPTSAASTSRARTSRRWSVRCPVVSVPPAHGQDPAAGWQCAAAGRTVQRPDIETLRALEDALLEFPGNTFVISHDRWFLDRIATHIIAFEGDSHVEFFQGNYREYEEDKKRRMGDDAAPKRLRFKALK